VCQERDVDRWAEQRVRSGEVGCPKEGSLVGVSWLRRQRGLALMASATASPRAAAVRSPVRENQAGLWALKSPRIKESFWRLKILLKFGVYWGGQEL